MSQVSVKFSPSWMRSAEWIRKIDTARSSLTFHRAESDKTIERKVYCASFETPIGIMYIASSETGLCKIALPKDGKSSFFNWINHSFSADQIFEDKKRNSNAMRQLNEYFIGKRTKFDLAVDLIGTPFQQRIWAEIFRAPYGTIVTYKQIARRVHTKGFRAVGATVGKNPLPIIIPCHRVIGSDYKLVGYSGGIRLKEYLLRLEGIILI